VSYVPLYLLGVPLSTALDVTGLWPRIMRARPMGDFGAYAARADDVIVCAGFKCGTTWMLQIATQIAYRGTAQFANIHHLVPWPDCPPILKQHIVPLDDPGPRERSPTGLRVIKTHFPLERVPQSAEGRYIALVRDPKDACVSSYHFMKSMAFGPMMPSVDTWLEMFIRPNFAIGSWAFHVASYWRVRDKPNVLFLTYEEVKRDHAAAVGRIAQFMQVELSAAELAEVVRLSSFGYMKEAQSKFDPGQVVPWGGTDYMIRRGEQGRSSELLTQAQRQRIDDTCREQLRELGSTFPYDELYAARSRA
jgi:hypothetical protein